MPYILKIAIVGAGRWGRNLIKEFSRQTEVKYCLDKNFEETTKWLSENSLDIPLAKSLDEILEDKEVEAIIISTPTETHFNIAKKSIEAGKNIFLEKPGCNDSGEMKEIIRLAESKNVKLAIGYEFIHHPVIKKIKELVGPKKIREINLEWNKWGTFDSHPVPNLLCHEISIIKTFGIEEIKPVNYREQKMVSDWDILDVEFTNNQNIKIKSHINRASEIKNKMVKIKGEDFCYVWNGNDLFEERGGMLKIETPTQSPVSEEIKDFIESIKENKKPLSDGYFALDILDIMEELY